MQESAEVPNLQMELNYLNSFKFYCMFSDLSHSGSCGCVDGREWVWVCLGVPPTCPHIHEHAHMCMHMHNTKIYMYSNCKWLPPWRHPCLSCLTCMCICACMCACMHMYAYMGHSIHPHPHKPTHPPPKGVTPPNQLKHYNTWTNQDFLILFEDLKSV